MHTRLSRPGASAIHTFLDVQNSYTILSLFESAMEVLDDLTTKAHCLIIACQCGGRGDLPPPPAAGNSANAVLKSSYRPFSTRAADPDKIGRKIRRK